MRYSVKDEYKYDKNNNKTINCYINDRLLSQIAWYDNKSIIYQKRYKTLTILSSVLSAVIPILTLTLDYPFAIVFKFLIAIISAGVSIISSILAINKYKELWVQYRTNCEILKSVLHRYYTHTGEFFSNDDEENFKNLVVSCEKYLTKEFDAWNDIYSNQNHSSTSS